MPQEWGGSFRVQAHMRTPTVFSREPLTIYLNDHLAGATAGVELAHRVASENEVSSFGTALERLATAIEEDRDTLLAVMAGLEIPVDHAKVAIGWTSEKIARLKPNGQLRGYSPLARLLELEGLLAGIHGKQALWRALLHAGVLDAERAEPLGERARNQVAAVQRLHRAASALALGDAEEGAADAPRAAVSAGR
jgi:hypothetical protein